MAKENALLQQVVLEVRESCVALQITPKRRHLCQALVRLDEIAEGFREIGIFRRGERIDAELVLESGHQNGKAQRVEAGIEQHQIVGQRRYAYLLLGRDLLDQASDC